MTYSKIYQKLHAYQLEIDIKQTSCPICHNKTLHLSTSGSITCKCGFVVLEGHDFVAGRKVNTQIEFKVNKVRPSEN